MLLCCEQELDMTTVLKTRPDRSVRPVQPGASSVRLKAPKPINNRKTGQKPGLNRKLKKKNGSIPDSIFKTMDMTED